MQGFLIKEVLIVIIATTLINKSQETCQLLKKSVTLYRVERILYWYVTCSNITPSEIHNEALSTLNSSSLYLEILNSDLPELDKDMFQSLNLTQLTIEANVQIIQEKTFEYLNVSTITLSNNKIRRIKENAFKSFAIYFLNLDNNLLSEIESQSFTGAQNLRKLNLQNNQISNIEINSLKDLGNLEEINLSYNRLYKLPTDLFHPLANIQSISLNNNLFVIIGTDMFIKNKLLQDLNINNNNLKYLDATKFPRSLVQLKLENNSMSFINVSNLINLQTLILNSNKIKKLTNLLNNLPQLNSLHLNNNLLGPIINDDIFNGVSNLSVLELDNNGIKTFRVLKNLKTLEGLSLAENNLTEIDFTRLPTNCKLVNLSQNSITAIKNLSNNSNILKLELSHNSLKEINFDTFEGSYQLRHLWLSHNEIKKINLGCFRHLKSLAQLDLSYNHITNMVSGALNGLDTIVELNLSYNNLSSLDEDTFHNMKNLRFLSIAYNNLSDINIKGILSHTIWLREIDLNGNNWTCKLLSNVSRDNKLLSFKGGDFYNVSNIYGIPCRESNKNNVHLIEPSNFINYNDLVMYSHDISCKLSFILAMIILYLIVMCGKFLYLKYFNQFSAANQFVYKKSQSESEIHII